MAALLTAGGWDMGEWLDAFRAARPTCPIHQHGADAYDPASIRYALAWKPPHGVLASLPNLEVIFSLGAGVDGILGDPELPDLPIVRLIDDDLTYRMGEWVTLQVLTHFRKALAYQEHQRAHRWVEERQPAAGAVRVGLLGYGVLAQHSADILVKLGFEVCAWSRTEKDTDVTLHVGEEGLEHFLAVTDILVVLLPLTDATRHIVNADLIAKLPQDGAVGPFLINAGRGALQNEADVLAALQSGTLKGASLDVFETEPLPEDSPMWDAPNLIITPHVAAVSDPVAVTRYVAKQMEAYESGAPLTNLVQRGRGY